MVDVTESYEELRLATEQAEQANWKRLWQKLDVMPTHFAPVQQRLDSLAAKIETLPEPPLPERVDLEPVHSELSEIRERLGAIPNAVLKPVHGELSDIRERIGAVPGVDLQPVHGELSDIRERISAIPSTDLAPIDGRLHNVETELASLGKRLDSSVKALRSAGREPSVTAKPKAEGPRLLKFASFGTKDDLKRISGVGPKLERLLNENGVFYFWQVASWSSKDVDTIDEKLDVFRGRILRDEWVTQATKLIQAPDAARMPTDWR